MTNLTSWISPRTLEALGWALVHFLWQGTALAALAAVGLAIFRRPAARYRIGVFTLGVMLLAPVATFLSYSQSHPSSGEGVKTTPTTAARSLPKGTTPASAPAQPSPTFSLLAFP